MLVKNYYTLKGQREENGVAVFDIDLNKDCSVYEGHFPGEPVSPGVCNIQMLKECIELVCGKNLLLNYIQQCRLTTLVTPLQHPHIEVRVQITEEIENGLKFRATIGLGETVYLDLKGEATFQ